MAHIPTSTPATPDWDSISRRTENSEFKVTSGRNATALQIHLSSSSTVQIVVNGEIKTVPDGSTVAALVQALGLQPRFVAVERNETLVPRTQHAACTLQPNDRIEVVTLVGGG